MTKLKKPYFNKYPTKPKPIEPTVTLSTEEVAWVRSMVVFEDDDILALNKPSGLSSQGGRGQVHTLDELLWAFAKKGGARPRLIHRLDRDTSGVILAAKTKPAAGTLGKAMMGRPKTGAIEAPLRRVEEGREAYMQVCAPDHPDAETALSRYRTLAEGESAALMELRPETGRMHQLRVHMASISRPIAGDVRYGGALMVGGEAVPRLMLHAAALEFPHPAGGTTRIEAPDPEDFAGMLESVGLAG
jgi:RluA family pseudouridine synthase